MTKDQKYIVEFWKQVRKADGCWLWTGKKSVTGYGVYYANYRGQRYWKAHRLSWALANRRKPRKDRVIAHACHDRACVNPQHLEEVTQGKNMADAVARGSFQGVNHGRSKLTDDDVLAIRASNLPDKELAKQYGMHFNHIYKIRAGKRWTHLLPS